MNTFKNLFLGEFISEVLRELKENKSLHFFIRKHYTLNSHKTCEICQKFGICFLKQITILEALKF